MILNAFRLTRDPITERNTFGYTRRISPSSIILDPTIHGAVFGHQIQSDNRITTNIVKMIEFYNRIDGDYIVERYSWIEGADLYPFKANYLNLRTSEHKSLLFIENIRKIHRLINPIDLDIVSPIQYHFDSVTQPHYTVRKYDDNDYFKYLHNKYHSQINDFSSADREWGILEEFIESCDIGRPIVYEEDYFKHFILPNPPIQDPYSFKYNNTKLATRNISPVEFSQRLFDVSEVGYLRLKDINNLHLSPHSCHSAFAELIELAKYVTDLSCELYLSGGSLYDQKIHYCVNRYIDIVDIENIIKGLKWIVLTIIIPKLELHITDIDDRFILLDDIKVNVIISYNEEVLFEVFNIHSNTILGIIHFDLAMLSLCASDIILFPRTKESCTYYKKYI